MKPVEVQMTFPEQNVIPELTKPAQENEDFSRRAIYGRRTVGIVNGWYF